MKKISAVYQIFNTVTKDFYIGSSKNVMSRWACHKCSSTWEKCPNSPMYCDMQKYGVDKFRFQILAPVMPEYLKDVEQELIEMLHSTYNNNNAKGLNSEKARECRRKYRQTEKGKEANRRQARKDVKKYCNQLCLYNGETLTLNALSLRFRSAGIKHPTLEAKKYLLPQ